MRFERGNQEPRPASRWSRRGLLLALTGASGAAVLTSLVRARREAGSGFLEDFSGDVLDRGEWLETASGDFSERQIRIVPGRGLEVRIGTEGTRDDTVKYAGARRRRAVSGRDLQRVRVTIDWNGQENASYLTASVVLSPHSAQNPLETGDWFQAGYVGVPPQGNARLLLIEQVAGVKWTLFDEGWPGANRTGRPISRQTLEIFRAGPEMAVVENDREVSRTRAMPWKDDLYVYLQVSSHSNYRPRSVVFGGVSAGRA